MKKIKKMIALFTVILTCCACAKDETIMTINKDKSLNLEVNLGYPVNSNNVIDINELKDIASSMNYFVDSYHDENFSGYRLSKKIDNINDVSIKKDITVNLADIINGKLDDTKLFKVKKGFFKNTYYANFTYNFKDIYEFKPKIYLFGSDVNQNTKDIEAFLNELNDKKQYNLEIIKYEVLTNIENFTIMNNILASLNDVYKGIPVLIINDKIINYDENIKENITNELDNIFINGKYIDIMKKEMDTSYELIYKVNLPSSALSNNATNSQNNNKNLTWNCSYFSENPIEYSFSMINIGNIVLIIIFIIAFIIFGFIGLILYKKYEKDKEKFIAKNTNISNITPDIRNDSNQIMSVNDLINK